MQRMKLVRIGVLAFFIMCHVMSSAKKFPQEGVIYRLTLKDKQGTPYCISHPEQFLSQKAIERRQRQGLAIDSTDLPISPCYIKEIEKCKLKVLGGSKWNNTVLTWSPDSLSPNSLEELPFVVKIQQVWTARPNNTNNPTYPKREPNWKDWDFERASIYGLAEDQISMINGIPLHNAGYQGQGMTIAVLDAGFLNVDSIAAFKSVKIVGTKNFVAVNDKSIFRQEEHGTMVLSDLAINVPHAFVGTAPEASYWLLRTEDFASENTIEEDYWAAAAEFADSVGVDIISSSLGYHKFDDDNASYHYGDLNGNTSIISHTASMLAQKGIIHVNSAGNEGNKHWKKINVPADAPNTLAVGALNAEHLNATFSSVGPSADGRVKPDVMSMGNPAMVIGGTGQIEEAQGTSFACPILAGMVACLWQALPNKTAIEIEDLVRKSADNFQTPNNVFGYGIPDFWKAYQLGQQH